MHFVVETISEFTYFENILMGLARSLKKCVGVRNTSLSKVPSTTYADITTWEQKYGVLMPEDLRSFYASSNGFQFDWSYTFAGDNQKDRVLGTIRINALDQLVPIFGYETCQEPGVKLNTERYQIKLSIDSRIFDIESIPDRGHVVLVYLYPKFVPTIWLLTNTMQFFFLANDITTYLKMAVTHLGIPNWQFVYTSQGVPQWTENLFRMLAPHLLPLNKSLEMLNGECRNQKDDNCSDIPLNKLDPNLFKLLPRTAVPVLVRTNTAPEPEKPKPIRKKLQYKQADQIRKTRIPRVQRKPLYYIKKR
ncbi:hypothetical protein RN001_016088 [Aquatica leii]|uniref:Tubulin polyglutamylase complex subunit 2 n=1 Tax=Aquatica leii TaxID=1421715 RepID=A0AAN7SB67_9COLE|nr:hypothetical protein RN001_016088 [Aquatica leii]